jgi:hypothetical protein
LNFNTFLLSNFCSKKFRKLELGDSGPMSPVDCRDDLIGSLDRESGLDFILGQQYGFPLLVEVHIAFVIFCCYFLG